MARIDHPELNAVWIAEDAAGDLSGKVNVEALRLARSWISRAEEIRVLVDTDDKSAALGNGPGRRLASGSQSVVPASGAVVTGCVPAGHASTGATVTGAGDAEDSHPARASASANSAVTTRALIGTP